MSERVVKDYTVIVLDHGSERWAVTKAVQTTGHSPEDAASDAECEVALNVWKHRHPGCTDPNDVPEGWSITERDCAWIDCMESVETIAVIEGHPRTYVEDAIYFPDEVGAGA